MNLARQARKHIWAVLKLESAGRSACVLAVNVGGTCAIIYLLSSICQVLLDQFSAGWTMVVPALKG